MDLHDEILAVLAQAKAEMQANMDANNENASGRTRRGFRVEEYNGGMRLVLAHEEFAQVECKPKGTGSVQVGVAPLQSLEIGRGAGAVPKGFYYIIKQWTRDKGLSFGKESERQTFAYFVAKKIAKQGTHRNAQPAMVFSVPINKAQTQIRTDIRAAIAGAIFNAAKTNF